MIEISSHFALIDPDTIRETMKLQRVTYIPTGAQEFAGTSPVSITQEPSTGASGLVWNISFKATTKDCSVREYNGRRMHIAVLMSDGSARIIGTASEAPLVIVRPNGDSSTVSSSFKSSTPLDL